MANPAKEPLPQVFINFRGDELRHKFVNNLAKVLRDSGINVFIDNYERKGRKLKNLLTRIKKSTIAIAIFSERYCESKWCLDELVTMNKQMEEKKLVVIPIFFNVRADEVKRAANPNRKHDEEGVPDGEFTVLFKKTKQKYAEELERIDRWEHAMRSVTERIGLSRSNYTNEIYLATDIVKEVKKQLHMPTETDWSNAGVAFLALFLELIFSFILAPRYFPDLKFFKTPEWFLGILVLVLACRIWYKKNQNKPRSTSFYAVCLCVVLLISSVFILIWVFKDDLVGFVYQLKLSA